MTSSGLSSDKGHTEFIYLILWKLRTLSDDEKKLWFGQWAEIQRRVPKGLRVGVGDFGSGGVIVGS